MDVFLCDAKPLENVLTMHLIEELFKLNLVVAKFETTLADNKNIWVAYYKPNVFILGGYRVK